MKSFLRTIASAAVFLLFLVPTHGYAQQDLRSTVELAIRSDSRAAGLTDAQISALVDGLVREATSKGVTAEDIIWRPTGADAEQAGFAQNGFLGSLNNALGFDGSDYTIPLWLGACSLMLIFLIAGILEIHHLHVKKLRAKAASSGDSVA